MTELGGDVRKNRRKVARRFNASKAHHIVMRSTKAKGVLSMLTKENKLLVSKIIRTKSVKYSIKIIEFADIGNHLHLAVKTLTKSPILAKRQFTNFLG